MAKKSSKLENKQGKVFKVIGYRGADVGLNLQSKDQILSWEQPMFWCSWKVENRFRSEGRYGRTEMKPDPLMAVYDATKAIDDAIDYYKTIEKMDLVCEICGDSINDPDVTEALDILFCCGQPRIFKFRDPK